MFLDCRFTKCTKAPWPFWIPSTIPNVNDLAECQPSTVVNDFTTRGPIQSKIKEYYRQVKPFLS